MGGFNRATTNEELLRQHEKDIASLKLRGTPSPTIGQPMTPSGVSGTGGAVGGPGVAILTNVSSFIDIQNLFDTDYEDYILYLDLYSTNAPLTVALQFLNASGVYNAAAYRSGVQTSSFGGGATSYASAAAAAINIGEIGRSSGAGGGSSELRIMSPSRSGTEVKLFGSNVNSGGKFDYWGWCGTGVGIATGIRIAPSTGTIVSGAVRCYGINRN